MIDRGKEKLWLGYTFLVLLIGCSFPCALCQDYYDGPLKGDNEGGYSEPLGNANLGFDDVVRRHDGYVKGEAPTIPKTSFSCAAQPYSPGLYADMEANCQVYHVCFEDRQESFLCGPGTNFNQKILACDFWYNFDCGDSASFYSANSEIGKVPDTVYHPAPSIPSNQRTNRPSEPGYSRDEQRPVPGGDYVPPRINIPPPQPQPQPRPRPQPPQTHIPRPQPQPPRIPEPSAPRVSYPTPRPLPPTINQEVDKGYDARPDLPIHIDPPRPVFPPVISPPRVLRPTTRHPIVIRRPDESSRIPARPIDISSHPDYESKGSDYRPPRPHIPQPSQPVDIGYPSFPSVTHESVRPSIRQSPPPSILQQEHVEAEYIPPPPPPPRRQPRPPPPPRRPIQQEVVVHTPAPIRQEVIVHPAPLPPPRQPQPSVIIPQQRRPSPPPPPPVNITPRPRRPPPRPQPVFPPSDDHPNANVKGGPGYRQPPPAQLPSYDPVRITHRPSGSTSQIGFQPPPPIVIQRPPPPPPPPVQRPPPRPQRIRPPPISSEYRPPITIKQPQPSITSTSHKRPQPPPSQVIDSIQKPSTSIAIRPPPPPQVDHPDARIKGYDYRRPRIPPQPVRVISPATSVSTVKRPQPSDSYQPPIAIRPPAQHITIKTQQPSTDHDVYQPPRRIPERRPVDHPNAIVKGAPDYLARRPQPSLPVLIVPPSAPSTSIQRTTPPRRRLPPPPQRPYVPQEESGYYQQKVNENDYIPPPPPPPPIAASIKEPVSIGVKRPSIPQQTIQIKPPQGDYNSDSNYKRGSELYPKPEFQPQPQGRPVSIPSRSSHRQSSASQVRVSQQQRQPSTSQTGRRSQSSGQSDYPQVPGHQPPNQRQVFPHRDNPDHPNESIKGTNAYRPPPPANFQSAASEVQEQIVETPNDELKQEPSSKLGDTGSD